ncbi:MAG TPA: PLD nuclease N-terminal domain-containing protein [Marmoricola sp.]
MIRFLPLLLVVALEVFCLVDVLTSREADVRHLPKIVWFLFILLFPLVGSVVWLAAGRPKRPATPTVPATPFPEYDRPGRAAGITPESDEEFLRRVRERAEEQRRKAAEEKKRDEGGADAEEPGTPTP